MKSLGNLPDSFQAEIVDQPHALGRAVAAIRTKAEALDRLRDRAARARVIALTGMGGSYRACHVPATVLGAAGVAAVMVDAAELVHFRRPMLGGDGIVVVVSQSGRSAEVVRLVEEEDWPRGRPLVVSVTNGSDNAAFRGADMALDTGAGVEAGPSTKTFAASLVALSAVTGALSGEGGADAVRRVSEEAGQAAMAMQTLLDRRDELEERALAWLGGRRAVAVLGRGTARAGSEMAALLLKEAARLPAESMGAGQFRHGPIELAGPALAVAIVATEPSTLDLDLRLAGDLERFGSSVLVIGPEGRIPPGGNGIPFDAAHAPRFLAPAVSIIPLQLLAWRLSADRGGEPGILTVATKVTTRE